MRVLYFRADVGRASSRLPTLVVDTFVRTLRGWSDLVRRKVISGILLPNISLVQSRRSDILYDTGGSYLRMDV